MSVFTIFNHGTDFNRSKQADEVISLLSSSLRNGVEATVIESEKAALGYSFKDKDSNYLICEGPGSEEGMVDDVGHTWPGNDNPITRSQAKDVLSKQVDTLKRNYFGSGDREFQDSFYGDTPRPWRWQGRAFGYGWNDNAYKSVWMLTHLILHEKQDIQAVNIIGWSRGAVTCLKTANLLNDVLPELDVNIFAYDPVPGMDPSEHDADTRTIPSNVKNYIAILALNDRRENFRCIGPDYIVDNSEKGAWVEFLPLPGNHSDVVRPNEKTSSTLRKSSKRVGGKDIYTSKSYPIGLALGYQFLIHFGTRMETIDGMINSDQALELYDEMQVDKTRKDIIDEYEDAYNSWTAVGARAVDRSVLTAYKDVHKTIRQEEEEQRDYSPYVHRGFVNTHHWLLAVKKSQDPDSESDPHPNLAHPYATVNEDRINNWNVFMG